MTSDKRDKNLHLNILFSAILKAISLATSFLIVPVTLHYLDNEPYGIWMTVSSMAFWIFTFDIGLGNGMRNYLTSAISTGNDKAARTYISSTFVMLSVIATLIAVVSLPLISLLDFSRLLNTSISNQHLQTVFAVAVVLTLINFVVKNIGLIYVAMQRYAVNDLLIVGGNVMGLIVIFLLTKTTEGSLLYVVTALMSVPVLIFIVGGIVLFGKHPQLRPSLKAVDINFSKGIITKGLGFFAIQITSCLVIFGGSNLFISHFQGPESVTVYNIAYKFFNLLIVGYTIVISPIWNAYTDAAVKGDWPWIRTTFHRTLKVWGLTVIAGLLMLLCCNFFYYLWVGTSVVVPLTVSASVLAFVTLYNLNNCVTYLLNGLNTIRVQICTSIVFTALYLTLIVSCGKTIGIEGIVLCVALCYVAMSLVHLYQCRLLINQKATGIWKK